MKNLGRILVLVALVLSATYGQEYSFRNYDRGLGNLSVNVLHQDRQGFIWVGTEGGLFRFDGSRFATFGRESGLPGIYVLGLAEDVTGVLWVATSDGLAYNSGNNRFTVVTYYGQPLSNHTNPAMTAPSWGGIIVVTPDGLRSLSISNGKPEWRPLLPPASVFSRDKSQEISAVLERRNGALLFGCGTAICQLKNGLVETWGKDWGVPPDRWIRLLETSNGEVWARSKTHIIRLRNGAPAFEPADLPISHFFTRSSALVEDSNGRILAGYFAGVARFENRKWNFITEQNGLSEGVVTSLLIDRSNQPWIGFSGLGLTNWLGYDRFENWTKRQGLATNEIWSILSDSKGRVWAGNRQGLDVRENGSEKFIKWTQNRFPSEFIIATAESKDGFLWFGSVSGVLQQVDEATQRVVSSRKFDSIQKIFVDSSDRIWIATDTALLTSEGSGSHRVFKPVSELAKYDSFSQIRQTPNGDMWVLTDSNLFWLSHGS